VSITNHYTIVWFQEWYQRHCNGNWEQTHGIHLGTLDNPGWFFTLDLHGTELEEKRFQTIKIDNSDDDWIFCRVKDNKFEGYCGACNLCEVLTLLRNWIENDLLTSEVQSQVHIFKAREDLVPYAQNDLLWLQNWYQVHCDGDWEHQNGVDLKNAQQL
jgi:hypothetical protein